MAVCVVRKKEPSDDLNKQTFIGALLEHLFKDPQPCWIIINNENSETCRKSITSRERETTIVHACEREERPKDHCLIYEFKQKVGLVCLAYKASLINKV